LGSTNGVRINGNRVVEGKLKGGDELTIGNFKYRICWDLPGEPIPAPLPEAKAPAQVLSKPVDQLLEDADQPIPLDENVAFSRILSAKPAAPRPNAKGRSIEAGTLNDEILPENLDLIPPSSSQNLPRG
jgi:hypothetical protein